MRVVSEIPLILYQFSRDRVKRGDFTAFLSRFGLERLPSGVELDRQMGGLALMVEGYDADPREISDRTKPVMEFFGLPFDPPPRE